MNMILKLLTGSFGSYILIAVAALFALTLSAVGVQTWRVHTLQADVATAKLDVHTYQQNAATCLASLDSQNKAVKALEAKCTTGNTAANAAAATELARLRERHRKLLLDNEHGPEAMNKFLQELGL